jgi:uncharacterized protein (TIGR03000 family)
MPRPKLPLLCGMLCTALTPLLAPAPALAEAPPGMSKLWPWNVGGDASWYTRPYSGTVCPPATPCRTDPPGAPPGVTEGTATAPLHLEVRVPADASVWVSGIATTQTGTLRRYVSQPLPVGPNYLCEIRATWPQGGRNVTEVRQFIVQAGQHLSVDFLRADSAALPPVEEGRAAVRIGQAP